jgi:hypothetical protein
MNDIELLAFLNRQPDGIATQVEFRRRKDGTKPIDIVRLKIDHNINVER